MLTAPRLIQDPTRRHGYALAVALILLVSAALRLWQLSTPAEMMFDEIYYAKDAKAIVDGRVGTDGQYRWAAGDEVSWPHPEMGKLAIAAGVLLFGDRSFGWRIPAVIAGIALLVCVYPLGRRLGLSPPWALLGLLFAAADPLGITQSRIATLDIFIAVWTVVSSVVRAQVRPGRVEAPLALPRRPGRRDGDRHQVVGRAGDPRRAAHHRLLLAAAAPGGTASLSEDDEQEAAPSDEHEAVLTRGRVPLTPPLAEQVRAEPPAGSPWRRIALVAAALVALPVGVYFLSYTQYFLAGHTWADFVELHRQAVHFNLSLRATHTYASIAPSWIIDYRPVWYYFEGKKTYSGVIAIGNPFLWWMATLSLLLAVLLALLRRSYALLPAAAIVAVLYLPWFATARTSFLYYMTPVAPFMAILVATALCLFAGGVIPRRGWLWAAGAAVLTAALWQPAGSGASWLFWTLPRRAGDALGWVGVPWAPSSRPPWWSSCSRRA